MAVFHEARWEPEKQEAADEFEGIEGAGSKLSAIGFEVAEGELVAFDVTDAVV